MLHVSISFPIAEPLETSPSSPATLLVLVPGAFLFPKDYSTLLRALSSLPPSQGVELWVAIACVPWGRLNPASFGDLPTIVTDAAEAAVEAAVAQGFPLQKTPQGKF